MIRKTHMYLYNLLQKKIHPHNIYRAKKKNISHLNLKFQRTMGKYQKSRKLFRPLDFLKSDDFLMKKLFWGIRLHLIVLKTADILRYIANKSNVT